MRESYRLQKHALYNYLGENDNRLSVFFLYVGKELPEYGTVFEKFGVILKRLIKITDENIKKPA